MPYSALNDLPADVRERAARVKLVAFDVDGVLTDNGIWLGPVAGERVELKRFDIQRDDPDPGSLRRLNLHARGPRDRACGPTDPAADRAATG